MPRTRQTNRKRAGHLKEKASRGRVSTGIEKETSGGESQRNHSDPTTAPETEAPQMQGADELRNDEVPPEPGADIVFQCASCRAVVGDTWSEYQEHPEYGTLSLKAASNVTLEKELCVSKTKFDSGCTYRRVMCAECGEHLGRSYISTSLELEGLRFAYTFLRTALISYQLGCSKTIDGHFAPNRDRRAPGQHSRPDLKSQGVSVEAFDALDVHVGKLTDATNKITEAFNQNKESISELKQRLEHTVESLGGQQENLELVQNMLLLWEERFQRLQACEQRTAKIAEDCQRYEDRERRLSQLEQIFRSYNLMETATPGNRPQSAPTNVMQSLRKRSSSPASSTLKRRKH